VPDAERLIAMQALVRRMPVPEKVLEAILNGWCARRGRNRPIIRR
jgi:hypothetical protein